MALLIGAEAWLKANIFLIKNTFYIIYIARRIAVG